MNYIDMIAKLGLGSAHPGGFDATLRQLRTHPLPAHARVLEVGCGTGRTACYLASLGMDVTAIDNHALMVHKTRERAQSLGVPVTCIQADGCALPFADASFDVVFVESVTSFAWIEKALAEYARVLRTGGRVYDREFVLTDRAPRASISTLIHALGLCDVWDVHEWVHAYTRVPFATVDVIEQGPFFLNDVDADASPDAGILLDADLWHLSGAYTHTLASLSPYCGYAVFCAQK
jgi:SAM-dependent methyltransferase